MNTGEVRDIIAGVLKEFGLSAGPAELPLDIPVEVSARHVHLTEEAVEALFGPGAKLTPKRPLSQPGQFLSEERVTLVTAKGCMENVGVLGPVRPAVQTELSAADARSLGIAAPLRMSGNLEGAGDVYIVGPKGVYYAKGSVIVAQAHIHILPSDAEKIGIRDGQKVRVTVKGERPVTFDNIICRVSTTAGLAMHIDTDEANACMLGSGVKARITPYAEDCCPSCGGDCPDGDAVCPGEAGCCCPADSAPVKAKGPVLITEKEAMAMTAGGQKSVRIPEKAIITPLAEDWFRDHKVTAERF